MVIKYNSDKHLHSTSSIIIITITDSDVLNLMEEVLLNTALPHPSLPDGGVMTNDNTFKFSEKKLESLETAKKQEDFWDSKITGLVFRVRATGTKTYFLAYRMRQRGAKMKWLKIATYEDLPLVRVREKAEEYRGQISQGIDPCELLRKPADICVTVADVVRRFMSEYAPNQLKTKTLRGYTDVIGRYILPVLGKILIKDLDRKTVADWHSKGKYKIQMNRTLAVLSSICTQAEVWELRPQGTNPCHYVKRNPETPRIRDVSAEEIEAIGKAIQKLESQFNLYAVAAIKIIIMCAGRVTEVRTLKYDEDLHLDKGYALVRDHKTSRIAGAKYLELPPEAIEIINALPRQAGNQHVFPSDRTDGCFDERRLNRIWKLICSEAQVTDLHLHDFRSYAASEALEKGIDTSIAAKILGHSDTRTTIKHYQRARTSSKAEAIKIISAPIAKALGLQKNSEHDPVQGAEEPNGLGKTQQPEF